MPRAFNASGVYDCSRTAPGQPQSCQTMPCKASKGNGVIASQRVVAGVACAFVFGEQSSY